MKLNSMKNMIMLKDLPSNIMEEAIFVLKDNAKIKDIEIMNNYKCLNIDNYEEENNEYVLQEAQMIVDEYITKIEENKKIEKKVNIKRIKKWAYISTIIAVLEFII